MKRPARGIVSLILTALLACGVAGAAGMVISCGSPEGGPASIGVTDDSGGNGGGGWGGGTAATPVITSQPQDAVYTKDADANPLSVTASVTGGGSLSYQWYSNIENSTPGGTEIPGATAADYTPLTDTEGTLYYYVVVTNAPAGKTPARVSSAAAAITVNLMVNAQIPSITGHPEDAVYPRNTSNPTALSVAVATITDGGTLAYQWYSNTINSNSDGNAIQNETAYTYTPPTDTEGKFYYYVEVTNTIDDNEDGGKKSQSVDSNPAEVNITVTNAQIPSITDHPEDASYPKNTTSPTALSVVASVTDSGTLTYQWYSNNSKSTTGGSEISDEKANTYTPPTTTEGKFYYYVKVTNTISDNGDDGEKSRSVYSNPAEVNITVTNAQAPSITANPQGAVYLKNAGASPLSVDASSPDNGSLSYQWYSNTSNSTTGGNAISTSVTYQPPTDTGGTVYYYVTVTNTITNNGDSGTKTASTTSAAVAITVIAGFANIGPYLSAASGGGSTDDPIPLPVNIDLSNNWTDLLSVINEKGKYVALDLSAAAMSGTEFDPGTANTGESKIVSLVLPAGATSIKKGNDYNATFKNFTALTSVAGTGIETVGEYAFQNCTALTTVSLDAATDIGESAFEYCTALTTVTLPKATSIGIYAFGNCTALTTVTLDAATSIYQGAFGNCTALTTVSLPKATSIGRTAFYSCTKLTTVDLPAATTVGNQAFQNTGTTALTVTLGSTVPTLGTNMFYNVSSGKTVTVKVPSGAAWDGKTGTFNETGSYTDNWGNGFRGKGWDGSSYLDGMVNSYISLTIETSTP